MFFRIIISLLAIISAILTYANAEEMTGVLGEDLGKRKLENQCKTPPCPSNSDDVDNLLKELSSSGENKASNNYDGSLGAITDQKEAIPVKMNGAKITILNKITAKSEEITFPLKKLKIFGNLSIEVHQCIKSTDPYKPSNIILLTIFDNKMNKDKSTVFKGWMFTNNPSISTLEHPVYEVIPKECVALKTK